MRRPERRQIPYSRAVSRRRFIRTAVLSGATLGIAGLGGLGIVARANERSNASRDMPVENTGSAGQEEESVRKSKREKIGEYHTDYRYSDSKARKYNLRMSAEAVDGTLIPSGETFAMNGHLEGLDYKSAKVFADGGETVADGGGLCQVASTE